jgi:iron complex transport system ATP-binding protein
MGHKRSECVGALSRLRKNVPRFSAKNLRQTKNLSGRSVGEATQVCLELKGVTVTAGRARLIEDVSFAIRPGTLTAVLGANGAGKSTALSVLAGDLRPAEGEALLDGRPIAGMPVAELAMRRAVVLQHAPMNFSLQVHEVVALSRTLQPRASDLVQPRDAHLRIEEQALHALGLMPLAGRDYATLSGGERQRVQIARALAQLWHHAEPGRAGFLLMDEPTAHLDLKHQIVALEVARAFAAAGGGALCILHDIGLAREFSDEVVLMKHGRIAARGVADALLTASTIADIYDIPHKHAQRFSRL